MQAQQSHTHSPPEEMPTSVLWVCTAILWVVVFVATLSILP